nr:uncharacterized mitochondrial protein AtMg00810-like [Tanacetum cinerariifolium]
DHLGKIDEKADDGFFLGYFSVAKAFRVFNIRRQEMEETFHVTFSGDDEAISQSNTEGDAINFNEVISFPDDEFKDTSIPNIKDVAPTLDEAVHPESAATFETINLQEEDRVEPIDDQPLLQVNSPLADSVSGLPVPQDRWSREKYIELVNIIGEPLDGKTIIRLKLVFINKVWTLVLKPYGKTIIGLKWVFRNTIDEEGVVTKNMAILVAKGNKIDEEGVVTKNMAILVAKGYRQEEGIDYDETFVPVARLEAIIIFLAYALYMGYQANPKESYLVVVKRISRYLKGTPNLGLWYLKGSGFDLKAYSDSDYVGSDLDRKSTSEGCQILGGKLVCWSAKKQTSMAMSLAEAEYVAITGCCTQVLWIKSQLADYDVLYDKVPIFCDNTSAIAISNNLVLHSRTKYIDISKTVVPLPPKGTVRIGLATLGENYHDESLTVLKPHHISAASFQTPSASEVGLTSHMLKVAKLLKKPDESLILSSEEVNAKEYADKSQSGTNETNELVDTAVPIQSLKASVTAEEVSKEQTLEIPSLEQLLEEVDNHNQAVQTTSESPYDTESEIKVVKSFLTSHLFEQHDQTMNDYEVSADIQENSDSDLHSMPDDELRSVLKFEIADSNNFHDSDVSTSDQIIQDDYASAKHLSLPDHMDHICEEVSSLHLRLEYLESSIAQKSLMKSKTQSQLNKKVMKQMNRQFNISHVAQSNRFVTLPKELSKVIRGGQEVIIDETAKGERKQKDTNAISTPTQGEHKTYENITPHEPSPKTQEELAYKESTLLVSKTKVNEESAMVLYKSEKKDLVDLTTEQDS